MLVGGFDAYGFGAQRLWKHFFVGAVVGARLIYLVVNHPLRLAFASGGAGDWYSLYRRPSRGVDAGDPSLGALVTRPGFCCLVRPELHKHAAGERNWIARGSFDHHPASNVTRRAALIVLVSRDILAVAIVQGARAGSRVYQCERAAGWLNASSDFGKGDLNRPRRL